MITNIKTVHQQRVHPEDDILYQWRLARKMEKARQGSGAFAKLPYMRERVFAPTVVNGGESSQGVNTLGSYPISIDDIYILSSLTILLVD